MREEVRQVVELTIQGIIKNEGLAREMAQAACSCEQDGHLAVAEEMRYVSRQYRIKGMEKRAKLALL
jgi:hypothetical protein